MFNSGQSCCSVEVSSKDSNALLHLIIEIYAAYLRPPIDFPFVRVQLCGHGQSQSFGDFVPKFTELTSDTRNTSLATLPRQTQISVPLLVLQVHRGYGSK